MYRPNRQQAADLCELLMTVTEKFRRDWDDPEGRTLSLAVCLFTGTVMAAVPEDRRDEMCDAMRGFALTAGEVLHELVRE